MPILIYSIFNILRKSRQELTHKDLIDEFASPWKV